MKQSGLIRKTPAPIAIAPILKVKSANPTRRYEITTGLSSWRPSFKEPISTGQRILAANVEYEKAIPDFTQAIRLLPNDLDSYAGRAKAYAKLGDRERAVADAKVAIKLKPKTEMSLQRAKDLRMRSTAYSIVGQPELASHDRREAVRLAPNDASTHEALAWFLATCPEERFRNGSEAVSSAKLRPPLSGSMPMQISIRPKHRDPGFWMEWALRFSPAVVGGD